jgi:hypothetical protein
VVGQAADRLPALFPDENGVLGAHWVTERDF